MTDFYRREIYGQAEWKCGRARLWVIVNSLLYSFLAACILIAALHEGWLFLAPAALAVGFFLWRIHRIHSPVVLVCRDQLLVLAPGFWKREEGWTAALFRPVYYVIDYQVISGFSDRWNEIYLGDREWGGLVSLRVPLFFLSRQDKARLCQWIEEKKEENKSY